MCKHVAAVLYGVGARLDSKPELLFTLRGVNHEELIAADAQAAVSAATAGGKSKRLAADDLSDVFGIELAAPPESPRQRERPAKAKAAARKPAAKVTKKPARAAATAKVPAAQAARKPRKSKVA